MKTYETIEFKVGETTFESIFKINMPFNYGDPVPECHSHCPITTFFYASIAQIINFINRGLRVNLENEADAEKIYFFLTEYNKQAAKYNREIGEEANPIASDAEKFFLLKLSYKIAKEDEKDDLANRNPFARRADLMPRKTNTFKPNVVQGTFKINKKKPKKGPDTRAPEEHKMYEMFNSPTLVAPDGSVVMNPTMENIIDTMPDDLDNMVFGDD